jgi:hypothetical protein
MKLITLFTSFMNVAVALDSAGPEMRVNHLRRRTPRPNKLTLDYTTSISTPTDQHSKATLHQVPAELVQSAVRPRGESSNSNVPQLERRQLTANDFFECTSPVRSPRLLPTASYRDS